MWKGDPGGGVNPRELCCSTISMWSTGLQLVVYNEENIQYILIGTRVSVTDELGTLQILHSNWRLHNW